ncbi:hypothetical protein AM1_A0211 (plasmid) [Acaryochloris marina MBIC11017]|uniref:Uncharacterized protein n=1 Tax=Acaryochloris marina (strain MBIC 11017) TaxID=329726 RepID=A8ZKL5_ACAM1|nr:hypothetical protein AM1_A0211 [Acaryochloris marina MBIC11017]
MSGEPSLLVEFVPLSPSKRVLDSGHNSIDPLPPALAVGVDQSC